MNRSQHYSSSFESAISFVLAEEGGYVNNPADNGGETKYGISQRAYPDLNIKSLSLDQATTIYHQDYWQKCRCDELPAAVACMVFDTAVNTGVSRAIRILQQALSVTVDGIIGPITIAACFHAAPSELIPDYLSYRARWYYLVAKQEGQYRFYRGWLKRTYELQQHLYEERLL